MTAADRDTLAALIDDWAMGTEDEIRTTDLAGRILASDWLAARDRRVAAQTEDTIFDEFPDNLTIAELRHAILLGRRLDTTEGTHHD